MTTDKEEDQATRLLATKLVNTEFGEAVCNYCDGSWSADEGAHEDHETCCPVPLAREVVSLRAQLDDVRWAHATEWSIAHYHLTGHTVTVSDAVWSLYPEHAERLIADRIAAGT